MSQRNTENSSFASAFCTPYLATNLSDSNHRSTDIFAHCQSSPTRLGSVVLLSGYYNGLTEPHAYIDDHFYPIHPGVLLDPNNTAFKLSLRHGRLSPTITVTSLVPQSTCSSSVSTATVTATTTASQTC